MRITSILIHPHDEADSRLKATAEVVLNGSLSLKGIKVMRGRYGLFLAFPAFTAGSPHKAFDALSMKFRKDLQTQVLKAYQAAVSRPVSLFA
jgi:DNA-binding cell septation regulator SpoVG